jgi:sec-independent protein translocase protein TatA
MLHALALLEGIGLPEILLILLVFVLLFGATKIPEMARNLGRAKAEFKRGEEEGLRQLAKDREDAEVLRLARERGIATEGRSMDEIRRELAGKS